MVSTRIDSMAEVSVDAPDGELSGLLIYDRKLQSNFAMDHILVLCWKRHDGHFEPYSLIHRYYSPIGRCNPLITFAVRNYHIIAASTDINILLRHISSVTCTPCTSEFHTHLPTIHHITQTRSTTNMASSRPDIDKLLQGTFSSFNWHVAWYWAAVPPYQTTQIQIHCWLYGESYTILNWNYLDQGSSCDWVASETPFHCALYSFCPQ